ncbi:histidinol dehydrogenase [Leucobacter sp. M11]|uniref:histidinol dehydrogenase n=1 Tax=Leucobacter sp. M11 TaxID=2993565 RepID=UPI002D8067AB|nr:histidinol dehydrogenase [Leucobacter sp. M11]MEB4613085.1 histidinol dehydrogenase [Leucobacter sp. M11]
MRTLDLRGRTDDPSSLRALVPRASVDIGIAVERVRPLVEDVRDRGEAALREQAAAFDRAEGHDLRVPAQRIEQALADCDPTVVAALTEMIARVRLASAAQVPASAVTVYGDGSSITQRWQAVDRVGLYVPGGKAVYPSSVVMNAVAAQAAGVRSIALASPAQADAGGSVHPTILAAAALLGVTEVYAIGGAGAIAAFAYGVPAIGLEPVDVVTGPGNIYVAAAKRIVNGRVGIDAEAGTTEILVIADADANPRYVAADLISQAEHDEAAASVLVTTSAELADAVLAECRAQAERTGNAARVAEALGGPQSAVILVDTLEQAAALSNAYAPEHLELQVARPRELAERITSAGAIFLGAHTPVSLGDYLAGSNHVLPTGGTARFASGLGAHTFLRPQQLIEYDRAGLDGVREHLVTLARAEHLPAHGDAVTVRFE